MSLRIPEPKLTISACFLDLLYRLGLQVRSEALRPGHLDEAKRYLGAINKALELCVNPNGTGYEWPLKSSEYGRWEEFLKNVFQVAVFKEEKIAEKLPYYAVPVTLMVKDWGVLRLVFGRAKNLLETQQNTFISDYMDMILPLPVALKEGTINRQFFLNSFFLAGNAEALSLFTPEELQRLKDWGGKDGLLENLGRF